MCVCDMMMMSNQALSVVHRHGKTAQKVISESGVCELEVSLIVEFE